MILQISQSLGNTSYHTKFLTFQHDHHCNITMLYSFTFTSFLLQRKEILILVKKMIKVMPPRDSNKQSLAREPSTLPLN